MSLSRLRPSTVLQAINLCKPSGRGTTRVRNLCQRKAISGHAALLSRRSGRGSVIQDLEGIDFADRKTAIAEAVAGARDLVAHGIMQNEDVLGHIFIIRDNHGATVPFRDTLPGRLRA